MKGILGLAAVLPCLWAAPVAAQSVVAGSVEGVVTSEVGSPLRAASVTLVEGRTGLSRRGTSGSGGSFAFTFVVAGEYDLRVEALGYRPQLMRGIILGPGETVRLTVQLPAEPPPVTRVDTVRYAAGGGGAWPGLGHRVTARDVDERPAVRFGLAPLISLSSQADSWGGFQGEAPGASVVFSDGEPFRAARHPGGTAGDVLFGTPFPRTGVSGLDVLQGMEDIEWNARGASVPVRTRPRGGAGGGAYGLGSSGPMWSATAVEDQPSLTSLWGGGEVSLALVPDTAVLSLSAEGGRIQTAQPPSPSDSVLAQLLSDGDVGTGVSQLTMVSAMGRVDWGLANGGQVSARAGLGTFERTLDRAQGPGLGYGVALPAKGTDASVSAVVATPLQDPFFLEVRGSLGYSDREYEPDASLPAAFVVGPRARVGPDPAAPASVSRLDVGGGPILHYRSGPHRLKAGVRVDFSSFDYTFADGSLGSYAYGTTTDVLLGQGTFTRARGTPGATFSSAIVSIFGQYRWTAAPGLDITAGARYQRQSLPTGDVRPSTRWVELTGMPTDSAPDKLPNVDARMHFLWDVQGNRHTWITGGMSLQYGEVSPDALAEYLTLDGGVRVQRGFGDVGSWPSIPDSAAAPAVGTRLAILGPGLQSPKTVRAAGALVRQVSPGVTLGVGGTYRRSEFLLRRNDLNRLVEAVGRDQNDQPLYGDLDLRGGVLAADPSTNRRFSEFESVWALDPDGWSEYRAFSVFMDAELRGGARLMADYTYSETTDNMLGAASGRAGAQQVPEIDTPDWEEGISDFDVPHRLTLTGSVPLPRGGALSVVYRFRSGLPFTPMVAAGLDANGDGSAFNDPAFIPTGAALDEVAATWDCVAQGAGALAVRNSCRGDPVNRIDARLAIGLGNPGGLPLRLVVDGLNLTDVPEGIRDDALLIADPNGAVTKSGSTYTVPYAVNPYFGDFVQRTDAGRMLRVGFQIGGGS